MSSFERFPKLNNDVADQFLLSGLPKYEKEELTSVETEILALWQEMNSYGAEKKQIYKSIFRSGLSPTFSAARHRVARIHEKGWIRFF